MFGKYKFMILLVIANFMLAALPTVSIAQEFDWDDDIIQARNPTPIKTSRQSNLPGVRKDPTAVREADKFCNKTSLSELFSQDLPSKRCPRNSLSIFEIQTDAFVRSAK